LKVLELATRFLDMLTNQ